MSTIADQAITAAYVSAYQSAYQRAISEGHGPTVAGYAATKAADAARAEREQFERGRKAAP
jgi:hypothetical protein